MKQIYLLKPMLFCFLLYLVQACYAISGFLYLRMPISEEHSLYDVRCPYCGDVIGQYEYTPCATYEKHIRPSTEFWGMTLYDENAHVEHLIVEAAPLTICEECLQAHSLSDLVPSWTYMKTRTTHVRDWHIVYRDCDTYCPISPNNTARIAWYWGL